MDLAVEFPLIAVTDKPHPPAGGTLHDFASMGPYWWPDPAKPDGLPYIRRDGYVNPEARGGPMDDAVRVDRLAESLRRLAERAAAPGDGAACRARAGKLLRVFFLDDGTRMNPSLTYGQAIPGICTGRGIGIIGTVAFIGLLDALESLEAGGEVLPPAERKALQAWFSDYLDWLLESPHGLDERRQRNNHGTWIDAQLCVFALFTGRLDVARAVLAEVPRRRLDVQIAADGGFPLEEARTRPFCYTVFNLRALLRLARIGRELGIDLWAHRTPEGATLGLAVERLRAVAADPARWTRPELDPATGAPVPLPRGEIDSLARALEEAPKS